MVTESKLVIDLVKKVQSLIPGLSTLVVLVCPWERHFARIFPRPIGDGR